MHIKTTIAAAVAALSLAACGSAGESGGDAEPGSALSDEELADSVSKAIRFQPGQYSSTVEVISLEMPDAPPETVEMMKQAMSGRNATTEFCLTPEEAAKGYETMAINSKAGDCKVQRFDVDGGDIDAFMICAGADGGEGRITLKGTGTTTSSDMTMTMETEVAGRGKSTTVLRTVNRRIGDCPG